MALAQILADEQRFDLRRRAGTGYAAVAHRQQLRQVKRGAGEVAGQPLGFDDVVEGVAEELLGVLAPEPGDVFACHVRTILGRKPKVPRRRLQPIPRQVALEHIEAHHLKIGVHHMAPGNFQRGKVDGALRKAHAGLKRARG